MQPWGCVGMRQHAQPAFWQRTGSWWWQRERQMPFTRDIYRICIWIRLFFFINCLLQLLSNSQLGVNEFDLIFFDLSYPLGEELLILENLGILELVMHNLAGSSGSRTAYALGLGKRRVSTEAVSMVGLTGVLTGVTPGGFSGGSHHLPTHPPTYLLCAHAPVPVEGWGHVWVQGFALGQLKSIKSTIWLGHTVIRTCLPSSAFLPHPPQITSDCSFLSPNHLWRFSKNKCRAGTKMVEFSGRFWWEATLRITTSQILFCSDFHNSLILPIWPLPTSPWCLCHEQWWW